MRRVIDIATCAIDGVESFIETPRPRKGTKDEAKQAMQIADKLAERVEGASLDLDLCRLTAVGWMETPNSQPWVETCRSETDERTVLGLLATFFSGMDNQAITYFGNQFDLLVLQRRARWLGVNFPTLNTDRYRGHHIDIGEILSDRTPDRRRSLGFYIKRHHWDDLQKPLEGAEEAKVHETQRWDELAASVRHDVIATSRLASWLKVW